MKGENLQQREEVFRDATNLDRFVQRTRGKVVVIKVKAASGGGVAIERNQASSGPPVPNLFDND